MPSARVIVALSLAATCAALVAGAAQSALGVVDLLTQANVRLDGVAGTAAGTAVSDAGDVNGDGRADVIVGAPQADNNARTNSGSAYVVFGGASTTVDLAALGTGGFQIDGAAAEDLAGGAVAGVGDLNADNLADVIVGAMQADNNGRDLSGSAYVVYGKASTTPVDLSALGSGGGFRIDGAAAGDSAGVAVSGPGDVNGDGRRDVLVGAHLADNNGRASSGSAYVVFGQSPQPATVDLLSLGTGGFQIDGAAEADLAAESVSGAGDVNGDAKADVIVGAVGANAAYVVFGKSTTATVELGVLGTVGNTEGFRMDGAVASTRTGDSVAGVGHLNGDALADVAVGAPWADDNARQDAGSAYVIFGKATPDTINLGVLGGGGFRIEGAASFGFAGGAVSGAGDVNADGRVDVLVGAPNESRNGRSASGSAYVVYGKTSTTAVDLSTLGTSGFRLDGAAADDQAGWSVSRAGDFNGDSRPDVLVGARVEGADDSGAAYIVFGFGQSQLAYGPLSLTVGQAIAPHAPTLQRTGDASFQVVPALPAGLVLDGSTGVVTGAPTVAQAQTGHTVTMTDLAGQVSAQLVVTVAPAPPPPPPPPPAVDRTPPTLTLSFASPQRTLRKKKIILRATCGEPCTLRAQGSIVFRGVSALIVLQKASSTRFMTAQRTLSLKLTKGAQRRLARFLAKKRKATAVVGVRARDRAGNSNSASRGIKIRR